MVGMIDSFKFLFSNFKELRPSRSASPQKIGKGIYDTSSYNSDVTPLVDLFFLIDSMNWRQLPSICPYYDENCQSADYWSADWRWQRDDLKKYIEAFFEDEYHKMQTLAGAYRRRVLPIGEWLTDNGVVIRLEAYYLFNKDFPPRITAILKGKSSYVRTRGWVMKSCYSLIPSFTAPYYRLYTPEMARIIYGGMIEKMEPFIDEGKALNAQERELLTRTKSWLKKKGIFWNQHRDNPGDMGSSPTDPEYCKVIPELERKAGYVHVPQPGY